MDYVNHPDHYTASPTGIECIDSIEASMDVKEFEGYLKGNIIKYIWRYQGKGNPLQDLKKAKWYLDKLIFTVDEANRKKETKPKKETKKETDSTTIIKV